MNSKIPTMMQRAFVRLPVMSPQILEGPPEFDNVLPVPAVNKLEGVLVLVFDDANCRPLERALFPSEVVSLSAVDPSDDVLAIAPVNSEPSRKSSPISNYFVGVAPVAGSAVLSVVFAPLTIACVELRLFRAPGEPSTADASVCHSVGAVETLGSTLLVAPFPRVGISSKSGGYPILSDSESLSDGIDVGRFVPANSSGRPTLDS